MSAALALTAPAAPHLFEHGDACFSPCGFYRYTLERGWPGGTGLLPFLLLNPSKATATEPDNTVTRCVGYAQDWGFNGLYILNLFAWMDTNPRGLLKAIAERHNPVGLDNDTYLREVLRRCAGGIVVVGWGSHPFLKSILPARAKAVLAMIREMGITPMCLGVNADGMPGHPLYLPKNRALVRYEAA